MKKSASLPFVRWRLTYILISYFIYQMPSRGYHEFSCGSETLEYTVCDYASGANIMTEDKRLFSIYF